MKISDKRVLADVAEVLYLDIEELDEHTDLRVQGMDSVRLMQLVDRWRRAGAKDIDYIVLAEDQRVSRWIEVLAELTIGETVEASD